MTKTDRRYGLEAALKLAAVSGGANGAYVVENAQKFAEFISGDGKEDTK